MNQKKRGGRTEEEGKIPECEGGGGGGGESSNYAMSFFSFGIPGKCDECWGKEEVLKNKKRGKVVVSRGKEGRTSTQYAAIKKK